MVIAAATEKQVAFLSKLAEEKDWSAAPVAAVVSKVVNGEEISKGEASKAIDVLMSLKSVKAATPKVQLEDGYYAKDEVVYKVQTSKETGNKYAKVLKGTKFVYAPGAMKLLAGAEKLTLEVAAAFGKKTGVCMICGRELTKKESIAQGIGPICAEKF